MTNFTKILFTSVQLIFKTSTCRGKQCRLFVNRTLEFSPVQIIYKWRPNATSLGGVYEIEITERANANERMKISEKINKKLN